MLKLYGGNFEDYKISIMESHQSTKTAEPGTAYAFANALKVPVDNIESVREPEIQRDEIGIPDVYLDRHAYHKIVIEDGNDQITLETKVLGHDSYAQGVKKIITSILNQQLENKRYTVLELIDQGLI